METIRIQIRTVKQLFNSFDPDPFLERDLDDTFADYLIDSVKEYPLNTAVSLQLIVAEDDVTADTEEQIKQAIRHYFAYRLMINRFKFKKLMRDARTSLLIGISSLAMCLILSEAMHYYLSGYGAQIVSEGFIIIGWVSMWKPINLFLYEWWPIIGERKVFQKIASMKIHLKRSQGKEKMFLMP